MTMTAASIVFMRLRNIIFILYLNEHNLRFTRRGRKTLFEHSFYLLIPRRRI